MRTEYISSQNFGQLHRYRSLMSKELFNQVSQAPCVEKFAKGYSANVFVTKIQSSKQPGTKHLALVFENIKPNTIFTNPQKKSVSSLTIQQSHLFNQFSRYTMAFQTILLHSLNPMKNDQSIHLLLSHSLTTKTRDIPGLSCFLLTVFSSFSFSNGSSESTCGSGHRTILNN